MDNTEIKAMATDINNLLDVERKKAEYRAIEKNLKYSDLARECLIEWAAIRDTCLNARIALVYAGKYSEEVKTELATIEDSVWQAMNNIQTQYKKLKG